MGNDITKMGIMELKSMLFDIDQQSKQLQQQYQQVGLELQKRAEGETNNNKDVQSKSK